MKRVDQHQIDEYFCSKNTSSGITFAFLSNDPDKSLLLLNFTKESFPRFTRVLGLSAESHYIHAGPMQEYLNSLKA